jgi:hypothetical protein
MTNRLCLLDVAGDRSDCFEKTRVKEGRPKMGILSDLAMVIIAVVFFAASWGFVKFCDRL